MNNKEITKKIMKGIDYYNPSDLDKNVISHAISKALQLKEQDEIKFLEETLCGNPNVLDKRLSLGKDLRKRLQELKK